MFYTTPVSFEVTVLDEGQVPFWRGDGSGDGLVDVADPIYNLSYQFLDGPYRCLDAQDTNDDGTVDCADPVYGLTYLFQGGAPPPPPFLDCGADSTSDGTGCSVSTCR